MDGPVVRIAPHLGPLVALGVAAFGDLRLDVPNADLDGAMAAAEQSVRERAPADGVLVRRMYSHVGLDPTRRRPSSEALLRRVQRGDPLPRINPLVDVCNWCSMEFQLPYGLYDLDCIGREIELRLGAEGERYAGIGKEVVHVAGRLVLADSQGPFGNPSSDSARSMVRPTTRRAVAVIFAPVEAGAGPLERALDVTAARASRFAGALVTGTTIVAA